MWAMYKKGKFVWPDSSHITLFLEFTIYNCQERLKTSYQRENTSIAGRLMEEERIRVATVRWFLVERAISTAPRGSSEHQCLIHDASIEDSN